MCFSAKSSFIASAGLLGVGTATMFQADSPNKILLAAIPLIYSAHQAVEGVLWLTGPGVRWHRLNAVATYAFLVVAQLVWPIYMPLALWMFEKNSPVSNIFLALLIAGCGLSIYIAYVITKTCLPTQAFFNHIVYNAAIQEGRARYVIVRFLYVALVVLPFLLSGQMWLKLYGAGLFLSFLAAARLYRASLTSVWCFFSAVLSTYMLVILIII